MSIQVGDRVRFTFACPTAPPCHKDYEGLTGTVTEVREYQPTIKNILGHDIINPHGNVTVRFDPGPLPGGHWPMKPYEDGRPSGSFCVGHVFPWELDKI